MIPRGLPCITKAAAFESAFQQAPDIGECVQPAAQSIRFCSRGERASLLIAKRNPRLLLE